MIAAILLPLLLAADAGGLVAEGDALYARRAEGASGARALPRPVEQAIAVYRRAVAAEPEALGARGRLIRALFFRATFCGASPEERKSLLEEAKVVGDEGMRRLDARVGKASGAARIESLRRIPQAIDMHFWTAVAWGEWAVAKGKLTAARQGAASRIRDLAQAVVDLDPAFEQGGGYRVLGRLHDRSPKILFVTGWVSHEKSVVYLRQALAMGPQNTVNQVFLAEAILDHDRAHADEARALLQQCASATPRPEFLVEDAHYAELSRRLLAQTKSADPSGCSAGVRCRRRFVEPLRPRSSLAHVFFVVNELRDRDMALALRIEGEILQQAATLEPGESLECRILLEAGGGGPLLYMEVGQEGWTRVLPPLSLDASPAAIGQAMQRLLRKERRKTTA